MIHARSGLVALADSVREYFRANTVDAEVTKVGVRYRTLWAKSRVVFVPGIYAGEDPPRPIDEGRLTAPEHTKSDNPRELATWERKATACILGVNVQQREDEQAQIEAVENLLELTIQAMVRASAPLPANAEWRPGAHESGLAGQASIFWDDSTVKRFYPPTDLSFGIEIFLTFTQRGPLFDQPDVIVFPQVALVSSVASEVA